MYAARILVAGMSLWFKRHSEVYKGYDIVVPVPADRRAFTKRGYHPPSLIAQGLFDGMAHHGLVQKRVDYAPQTQKTGEERLELLQLAPFEASPTLRHKSVLVIDDVITTGATLAALCQELKRVGVRRVACLAIAANYKVFPHN